MRARLTSGRSCSAARVVFFIAQPQAAQAVPQRRDANRNPKLRQTSLLQFPQGQIRLGFDPALQPAIMGRQAGTTIAANLLGQTLAGPAMRFPKSFNTLAADTKAFADSAGAFATLSGRNNPLPQILA
jgi:hypothetical protein